MNLDSFNIGASVMGEQVVGAKMTPLAGVATQTAGSASDPVARLSQYTPLHSNPYLLSVGPSNLAVGATLVVAENA